jgi:hypothetical protein
MPLLNENKIQCSKCGDVIISESELHPASCKCGHVKVSGGKTAKIRSLANGTVANPDTDFIELSTYVLNE